MLVEYIVFLPTYCGHSGECVLPYMYRLQWTAHTY